MPASVIFHIISYALAKKLQSFAIGKVGICTAYVPAVMIIAGTVYGIIMIWNVRI